MCVIALNDDKLQSLLVRNIPITIYCMSCKSSLAENRLQKLYVWQIQITAILSVCRVLCCVFSFRDPLTGLYFTCQSNCGNTVQLSKLLIFLAKRANLEPNDRLLVSYLGSLHHPFASISAIRLRLEIREIGLEPTGVSPEAHPLSWDGCVYLMVLFILYYFSGLFSTVKRRFHPLTYKRSRSMVLYASWLCCSTQIFPDKNINKIQYISL